MKAFSRDECAKSRLSAFGRALITPALLVAVASLATTTFIQVSKPADADENVLATPAPLVRTGASLPPGESELGHFAFGYLEFDWNPADGVPGFDSWPRGTQR